MPSSSFQALREWETKWKKTETNKKKQKTEKEKEKSAWERGRGLREETERPCVSLTDPVTANFLRFGSIGFKV